MGGEKMGCGEGSPAQAVAPFPPLRRLSPAVSLPPSLKSVFTHIREPTEVGAFAAHVTKQHAVLGNSYSRILLAAVDFAPVRQHRESRCIFTLLLWVSVQIVGLCGAVADKSCGGGGGVCARGW